MHIDRELADFLGSAVMIIIGTSDARGHAGIARGVGARVDATQGIIEVVFSGWQWPDTQEHLQHNHRIALTFSRPADYVSYQLKGRASVREATSDDLALASRYCAAIRGVLTGLGLDEALLAPWLSAQQAQVARVTVEAIFVQTPGSGAGRRMEPTA